MWTLAEGAAEVMKVKSRERLAGVREKRAMVVKELMAKRRGMWEPIIGLDRGEWVSGGCQRIMRIFGKRAVFRRTLRVSGTYTRKNQYENEDCSPGADDEDGSWGHCEGVCLERDR